MHDILYFPHYAPSANLLRSLLLFYEEIKTIVPRVDQPHVSSRDHVAELIDLGCKISYVDPTDNYYQWTGELREKSAYRRLVNICARCAKEITAFNKIQFDSCGLADWGQDDVISEFVHRGWSLIAAQKIPAQEIEKLRRSKLAIPMRTYRSPHTGRVVEENPVLLYPEIGDFILARLAREVSARHRIPTVTFDNTDYCNHIYSEPWRREDNRAILISAIVSMSIPHDVEVLRAVDYAEVRDAYAPARLKLESMIRELSENYRLDGITDFQHLENAIADAASDIERRVQSAMNDRRSVRYRMHKVLNQNILWGVGGALAGYGIGGPLGAAAGGIVSPLAAELANKISPPKASYEMVETLASIRASIERGISRSNISLPSYMI